MPYQDILAQAWRILKRQRALWLFGFLSACAGGSYGNFNFGGFNFQMPSSWFSSSPHHTAPYGGSPAPFKDFGDFFTHVSPNTLILIGVIALLVFVVWLLIATALRALAEPAIIRITLHDLRQDVVLSVGEAYALAKPFFWRAFGFFLLIGGGAGTLAILLAILGIALIVVTHGVGIFCLLPGVLLAIPVLWGLALYFEMAILALLVEGTTVWQSFSRGWEVFKDNFWQVVLTGLLLAAVRLGVGLLIAVVAFLLLAVFGGPLVAMGIAMNAHGLMLGLLVVVGVLLFIVWWVALIFLSGLVRAYIESAWTLAYLHWLEGEAADAADQEAPPSAEEPPLPAPQAS